MLRSAFGEATGEIADSRWTLLRRAAEIMQQEHPSLERTDGAWEKRPAQTPLAIASCIAAVAVQNTEQLVT